MLARGAIERMLEAEPSPFMTPESRQAGDTGQPRGRPRSPGRRGLDRRGDRRGAVGQAGALRAAGARSPAGQHRLLQHLDHPAGLSDQDAAGELPARLPDHPFLQSSALHAAVGGGRRPDDPAGGAGGDHPLRRSPPRQGRRACEGHPGLHRQPDRHLLAADGDRPGDRAGPDRRGGRRRPGRPGGHSQDRRVRAARSGRHRLDPEGGFQHGSAAAGQRPAARQPTRAAPDPSDDRGWLDRPEGQGRLLPPEPSERRAGQGGHRPPHRRLPSEWQSPAGGRRRREVGRPARAGVPPGSDGPLRLDGAE